MDKNINIPEFYNFLILKKLFKRYQTMNDMLQFALG